VQHTPRIGPLFFGPPSTTFNQEGLQLALAGGSRRRVQVRVVRADAHRAGMRWAKVAQCTAPLPGFINTARPLDRPRRLGGRRVRPLGAYDNEAQSRRLGFCGDLSQRTVPGSNHDHVDPDATIHCCDKVGLLFLRTLSKK